MSRHCFIALLLLSCQLVHAQIAGVIRDQENQPVELATIRLYQLPDSVLIAGSASNSKGEFSFPNSSSPQLILKISSVGYETIIVPAKSYQEIILKGDAKVLQDVVISAKEIETFGSKDKLLIPQHLKERSSSLLAALGEMPQFQLNRASNILQTIDHQKILILIDGVQANESELMVLPASKIRRVEYFTQPPARFANKNVGAVLSIFTIKEKDSGFNAFINTTNSFTTGYGTNIINSKWYNPNHQLSLSYFIDYRNLNGNRINQTFEYEIGNEKISNELHGQSGIYKGEYHIIGADYLYRPNDSQLFSTKIRYRLNPGRENHQQITSTKIGLQTPQQGFTSKKLKSNYEAISLDLYYNRKLKNNQELTANLVGTYFDSKSDNQISQDKTDHLFTYEYNNHLRNYSNSIISELLYNKSFSNENLSIGARYFYKQLRQTYNENTHSTLDQQVYYLYSNLAGKVKNIYYTIGVGIEHSIQGSHEMKAKHYTLFKPSFSASYQMNQSSSLRFNSLILSNAPEISQLSTHPVYLNYQYYSVGNPNLRPYYTFYNRLQYQLSLPSFYMSAALRHSYLRNPYMVLFESRDNEIIKTLDHYKHTSYSAADLSFQWSPFSFLKIQPYATLLYTNAMKPNGSNLSEWSKYISITSILTYKEFSLLGNVGSSMINLLGDVTEKKNPYVFSELSYSKNNVYVGLQYIHNPIPSILYSNNRLMNFREETIWNNFQNLFAINFRYNFTIGRKKSINASTKLKNEDNVSGLSRDAIAK